MAIWDAAGPTARICSLRVAFVIFGWPFSSRTGLPSLSVSGTSYWVGWTTVTFAYSPKVWTTPWETRTSASTNERGSRM